MNTIKHDMETWFKEVSNTADKTPITTFFNTKFKRALTGKLRIPAWFHRLYPTADDLERFAKALGMRFIDIALKLHPILKQVPFSMLEDKDREYLREYICIEIQNKIFNKQIVENISGVSISGGSRNISIDRSSIVFTIDNLCSDGKTALRNAEIYLYELVGDNFLHSETKNGNYKILRWFDVDKNVPQMVWDKE